MEAATAVKSFKGWRISGGEYAHSTARKLMHSQSLHVSCRFQAPSAGARLSKCREQRLGDGWLSMETRRRRSNIECHSSCTDTYSSSIVTVVPVLAPATAAAAATTTTTTTTHNNTHNDLPASTFTRQPEHDEVGVQELTVYEVNELDRGSPVLLFSSKLALDWYNRLQNLAFSIGDLVPFTNKIFDGSLKKRLGITAGIISVIRYYPKEAGVLFEAIYSFYFGDFGHISIKGPYKSHEDTVLTVTGGSGIFAGVYGTVEIRNVEYPIVLFYKFKLHGIPKLPQALRWKTVPPAKGVRPSHNASLPGVALPNFTD